MWSFLKKSEFNQYVWEHLPQLWGILLFLSDVSGSGGVPIDGEQEGEGPAFRAGKGQAFPTGEPR